MIQELQPQQFRNKGEKDDWTKHLPSIPSLSNILNDDDVDDNHDNDDTRETRAPIVTRSKHSASIDDTNNTIQTEQQYLDLIPPGKLEIEIQDCTLSQQKNIFDFRHPLIYVKTNCLE